jgi:hypothetical protein
LAQTISDALADYIATLPLGLLVKRDGVSDDAQKPYVTIDEAIAVTPDGFGDGGVGETCTEQVQVNLWEDWKDEDDYIAESPTLASALARGLHGAKIDQYVTGTRVYGVRVISRRRLLEPATNTVHTPITANVRREL